MPQSPDAETGMAIAVFRLIVFDLDGTIVDSQSAIVNAMQTAFTGLGLALPAGEEIRRGVGLSVEAACERLLPPGSSAADGLLLAAAYRQAFAQQRLQPDYLEPLYPGVRETLAVLDRPEGFLGIATGKSRRGLIATLSQHDLLRHFSTLQTADAHPSKPDPSMLLQAMAEVGVEPEETAFVGDTVYDMAMAKRAGACAVGVSWGYHGVDELRAAGAWDIATRFDQLPPLLNILGATR